MESDIDTEINSKQLEIIDFINDKLIQYEMQAKIELKPIVENKFGSDGVDVWNMIEEDDDTPIEDCVDCGEISDDWIQQTKQKLDQFEMFVDDQYDSIVRELIDHRGKKIITTEMIQMKIRSSDEVEDCEIDNVTSIIKRKILFDGIINGWLEVEYFQ